MRVLVACECSGVVRDAFAAKGHYAMSCDLQPTDSPGPHYQGDIFDVLDQGWDLMIGHPPCTYLTSTGARWLGDPRYPNRYRDRDEAADFFMRLYNTNIPKVCLENPVGYMSTYFRKPDQYVHPYHFGHPVSKKTGLWLKGLKQLVHTKVVEPEMVVVGNNKRFSAWYHETSCLPLKDRQKARSKTFQGIADAMADQWG